MGSQFALRASGEGGGFNDAKMKESLFARARAAAEAGRSDLQRLISDGVCLGGRARPLASLFLVGWGVFPQPLS